ncbi:MAG TPA: hypothetical protein PKN54_04410 [Candidatus Cloacimonas acidaminovorans]|nr:hypothetical protein [Candidatus Cloacimonas acidaminovorans]
MSEQAFSIEIVAKKLTIKNGTNAGKPFTAYKAITKGGKLIDLAFTQEVSNAPKEEGRYVITVPVSKINLDKKNLFPKVWVKEVTSVTPKVTEQKIDETVISMFGKEDLPF